MYMESWQLDFYLVLIRTVYSFEGATIVYCRTRKMTEEVAAVLKSKKKVLCSKKKRRN